MMLEKVKLALRFVDSAFNSEIQNFIDACVLDLKRVGIIIPDSEENYDAQIEVAIILYCRWHFDFENDGSRYKNMYMDKRADLALCEEYTHEESGN